MTEVPSNGYNHPLADLVVFGRTIFLDDRALTFFTYICVVLTNHTYSTLGTHRMLIVYVKPFPPFLSRICHVKGTWQ